MRVHPGPLVALLMATTVLAGCFGSSEPEAVSEEVVNKEGMAANAAIAIAQEAAREWHEGALLVGAQGEERSTNTSIAAQPGVGAAPPDDPVVGDGRAPVWLVGFRAESQFLLLEVDGDGGTTRVANGMDHPIARAQAVLSSWSTDSPAALAIAKAQPSFSAVAEAEDVVLSMYLSPANPALGTDPATEALANHAHWVVYATSMMQSAVALARIDATTGQYVDDGSSSTGEGEPVHDHASFAVFIDGEELSFAHPDYDVQSTRYSDAHLRTDQPNGGNHIHIEGMFKGGVPDVTLADFLGSLGVGFSVSVMTIDGKSDHNGTRITDGEGKKWSVYVSQMTDSRQPFELETGDYAQFYLRDGMEVLLTFGSPIEMEGAELERQQAAVPEPPQS